MSSISTSSYDTQTHQRDRRGSPPTGCVIKEYSAAQYFVVTPE